MVKMESCGQARSRSRSPHSRAKEYLERKRLEIKGLTGFAPDVWETEPPARGFKELFFDNDEPRLPGGPEPEAKKDESLGESVSCRSPKVKRILCSKMRTEFEPADKQRAHRELALWSQNPNPQGGPAMQVLSQLRRF